jgi:hypothetical protein
MLSRLISRALLHPDVHDVPIVPDFPECADLPHLSDQEAEAALELLRLLVDQGRASVYTRPYTPEGKRPRWNVWDMTVPRKGRRVELEPWAMGVLSPPSAASEDTKSPIGGVGE